MLIPDSFRTLLNEIEIDPRGSALLDTLTVRLEPLLRAADEASEEPREADFPTAAVVVTLGWIDAICRSRVQHGRLALEALDGQMLPTDVTLEPLFTTSSRTGVDEAIIREALDDLKSSLRSGRILPPQIIGLLGILRIHRHPKRTEGRRRFSRISGVPSKMMREGHENETVAVAKGGSMQYALVRLTLDGLYGVERFLVCRRPRLDAEGENVTVRLLEQCPDFLFFAQSDREGPEALLPAIKEFQTYLARKRWGYQRLVHRV